MTRTDRRSLPIVALLLGDATGIGPELCARVLSDGRLDDAARLVVVGGRPRARAGHAGCRRLRGLARRPVGRRRRLGPSRNPGRSTSATSIRRALPRGAVSTESGRLTGETLAHAVAMARRGEVDAITFAPLNKAALHGGGWRFPDEHKMFAHLLGHQGHFAEMNVLDGQWMSRVTGHLSLREALDQITTPNIVDAIRLADRTMRRAGIARPRLAVAALNPHAGEGGLFGREEIEVIGPGGRRRGGARDRLPRAVPRRHHLPQGFRGRVRRRGRHVPRPGADRDEAPGLQSRRDGHRGSGHGLHHPRPRHGLRHRRPGRRLHRRAGKRRPPRREAGGGRRAAALGGELAA